MCLNCHWQRYMLTATTPNGTVVEAQLQAKPTSISAETFYNYNTEMRRSASTPDHLEENNVQKIFIVKQELPDGATRHAFVMINDATFAQGGDRFGGMAHFKLMNSTLCKVHPGQARGELIVRDDPVDDPLYLDPKDHFDFDSELCTGNFIMFWGKVIFGVPTCSL